MGKNSLDTAATLWHTAKLHLDAEILLWALSN